MPTTARARHRVGTGGPWGTGLLILGVAFTALGVGYAVGGRDRLPAALADLSTYVPAQVWGGLWITVGLWLAWKALTPPQRHWHVLPPVGLLLLWSAAYWWRWALLGVAGEGWTRDWLSAVSWGAFAGLVASWGRCVNPPARLGDR